MEGPMMLGMSFFGLFSFALLGGLIAAAWLTGAVTDINNRRWLWLIGDCVLPVIGVVRGMLVWINGR